MTFRKWTNWSGRTLSAVCLAAMILLLAACSAGGRPAVAGPGGDTGAGTPARPAAAA